MSNYTGSDIFSSKTKVDARDGNSFWQIWHGLHSLC